MDYQKRLRREIAEADNREHRIEGDGRGDKEEGSDVGKEEDSIHESFLRPLESTLRPIYLWTIERKEGRRTDRQTERRQERSLSDFNPINKKRRRPQLQQCTLAAS